MKITSMVASMYIETLTHSSPLFSTFIHAQVHTHGVWGHSHIAAFLFNSLSTKLYSAKFSKFAKSAKTAILQGCKIINCFALCFIILFLYTGEVLVIMTILINIILFQKKCYLIVVYIVIVIILTAILIPLYVRLACETRAQVHDDMRLLPD